MSGRTFSYLIYIINLESSGWSKYPWCSDWFREVIIRLWLMPLKHDNWNPIIFHMRKYAKYYNIWHVYHGGINPAIWNRGLIFWSIDILSSFVLQTQHNWFRDNEGLYLHAWKFNSRGFYVLLVQICQLNKRS